jgi:hypothetical protein
MCREHPPSSCRRAPEGAREAFDGGVAITSLLAPFQGAACEDVVGRDVSGGFTISNLFRASGSIGSKSTKSQAFNSAANFGQQLSKSGL